MSARRLLSLSCGAQTPHKGYCAHEVAQIVATAHGPAVKRIDGRTEALADMTTLGWELLAKCPKHGDLDVSTHSIDEALDEARRTGKARTMFIPRAIRLTYAEQVEEARADPEYSDWIDDRQDGD